MESSSELSCLGGIKALNLKVGPVRRSLFGPVDRQQLEEDFKRLLRMSVEAANKRWNFDFQSDEPGSGSGVEWEALRCQDVPAFYHGCAAKPALRPVGAAKGKRRLSSTSSCEDSPMSSGSSGSGDEYFEVTTRGCYRLKRQSNITG